MSKRYTMIPALGEPQEFARKEAAIRSGEKIGEAFQVLSPAGSVVHDYVPADASKTGVQEPVVEETPAPLEVEPVVEETPAPLEVEPEEEDLIGEVNPAPEATGSYTFPGNYSISFVRFAQTLADAVGGLDTRVEKTSGLARIFHFAGSAEDVAALAALLEESVPATHAALRVWQKENIESRRGKTDMVKFLEHRAFIEQYAHTIAEGLSS